MPKVRCNNCETVFASEDDVVHDKAPEDTEGGEFIK